MKYYVTSDTHGYYSLLKDELQRVGFFDDPYPHKLVICGDLMDRGKEAKEMEGFVSDLMDKDQLILVRGNHEDLFEQLLHVDKCMPTALHMHNGTFMTLQQLTGIDIFKDLTGKGDVNAAIKKIMKAGENTAFYSKIMSAAVNYFETQHYVFVHGWIPYTYNWKTFKIQYDRNWRHAEKKRWDEARWSNGMDAYQWVTVPCKTVVCGHYHTSYGHCFIEKKCPEFGPKADFSPFVDKGIIALDACTAYTNKINVIVIEDEPLLDSVGVTVPTLTNIKGKAINAIEDGYQAIVAVRPGRIAVCH